MTWDRREPYVEELDGLVLMDRDNRTIEFRQCLRIDLSIYEKILSYYAEGPGIATWKTVGETGALVRAQDVWNESLVTPLLKHIATITLAEQ